MLLQHMQCIVITLMNLLFWLSQSQGYTYSLSQALLSAVKAALPCEPRLPLPHGWLGVAVEMPWGVPYFGA